MGLRNTRFLIAEVGFREFIRFFHGKTSQLHTGPNLPQPFASAICLGYHVKSSFDNLSRARHRHEVNERAIVGRISCLLSWLLCIATARLSVACYSMSENVTLLNFRTIPPLLPTQLWSGQIQQMLPRAPSTGLRSAYGVQRDRSMGNLPYGLG